MISSTIKLGMLMFFMGLLGILSSIPVISQLIALQPESPPVSITTIQFLSVAQSSILLLLMIWVGVVFSNKVNLKAPVTLAIVESKPIIDKLKPQIKPAIFGGILGGLFIVILSALSANNLPVEFLDATQSISPPWYTKILYGGITEELLIRWGIMSFLVWLSYRVFSKRSDKISPAHYIFAIIVSAILFGIGHLPIAFALAPQITSFIVIYVVFANTFFGLIAGFLFWKYGLECAIAAHIIAHITMMSVSNIF